MTIGKATIEDISEDVIGARIRSLILDLEAAREARKPEPLPMHVSSALENLRAAQLSWEMSGMKGFVPPCRLDPHVIKTADVLMVEHEARFMNDSELVDRLDTLDVVGESRETVVGWLAIGRLRLGGQHPSYARVLDHTIARVRREEPEELHAVTIDNLRKV